MAFRLSPLALREGYRIESHDSVGSTSAVALDHARAGDPGRLWITTLSQPAGRGRRGRPWAMLRGNLATSLLLRVSDVRQPAALGFVAGLTVADALDAVAPEVSLRMAADSADGGKARFTLKWPNDVLADGAKLVGILLESTSLPGGELGVAVGIGINVAASPDDTPYPATSLRAMGSRASAEQVFEALTDAWVGNAALWNEGRGLDAVRRRWLTRAAGLGGEVRVMIDGRIVSGTFETIDEECRFVLREHTGRELRITAGDVHFGAVASARA